MAASGFADIPPTLAQGVLWATLGSWLILLGVGFVQAWFLATSSDRIPESARRRASNRNRRWLRQITIDHGAFVALVPTGLLGASITAGRALPLWPPLAALAYTLVIVGTIQYGRRCATDGLFRPDLLTGGIVGCAGLVFAGFSVTGLIGGWLVWALCVLAWHVVLTGPLLARGTRGLDTEQPATDELKRVVERAGHNAAALRVRRAVSSDEGPTACAAGIGPTMRVIVHEHLLRDFGTQAVIGVVAHELGHITGRHRLVYFGLGILIPLPFIAGLNATHGMAQPLEPWTSAFVAVALYLGLPVIRYWLALAGCALRRWMEVDADRRATRLTAPANVASALRTLQQQLGGAKEPMHVLAYAFRSPYPSLSGRCARLEAAVS